MKDFLEKRFKHRTWFKGGVAVGFALDYFAKISDFYLNKKTGIKAVRKPFGCNCI